MAGYVTPPLLCYRVGVGMILVIGKFYTDFGYGRIQVEHALPHTPSVSVSVCFNGKRELK